MRKIQVELVMSTVSAFACICQQMLQCCKKLLLSKKVRDIHALPCEEQCHKVLSELCKTQEKHPNKYCYVKFPFGYIDYSGLKELLGVHERRAAKRCIEEEREWLEAFESGLPSPLCTIVY